MWINQRSCSTSTTWKTRQRSSITCFESFVILRIRERAYQIWAANGGDADQNWLRAETEILNTSAAQPPESAAPEKAGRLFQAKVKTASLG
jgi:hypothetical protein